MTLRNAGPDDLPAILAIYNHAVAHTTATADYDPQPLADRVAWYEDRMRRGLPVLVAEADGAVVGWGSLSPYNPRPGYRFSVENSVYVAPGHQGRGVGRALLARLIEEARAREMRTVVASIDALNVASIRLHESFGFVEVARYRELFYKFGRWLDVVHLQLLLD